MLRAPEHDAWIEDDGCGTLFWTGWSEKASRERVFKQRPV